MQSYNLQLPPLTLVYGEWVTAVRKDEWQQVKNEMRVFNIIDAGFLNGVDISGLAVSTRWVNQFSLSPSSPAPGKDPLMNIYVLFVLDGLDARSTLSIPVTDPDPT